MSDAIVRTSPAPSLAQWPTELPPVLTVAEAGRLIGLSRSAAYRAASRGDLPTLRFVSRLVVPTNALLDLLGLHGHVRITLDRTSGPTASRDHVKT